MGIFQKSGIDFFLSKLQPILSLAVNKFIPKATEIFIKLVHLSNLVGVIWITQTMNKPHQS